MQQHRAIPIRKRRKLDYFSKKNILTFGGIVAFIVTLIVTTYHPAKDYVRAQQATSHLKKARNLAQESQWEDALHQAQQAMRLQPSLGAIQLLTKCSDQTKSQDVLSYAFRLFQYPGASLADRTFAFKTLLDRHGLQNALDLSLQIKKTELNHPPLRHQLVRAHLLSNNVSKALAVANEQALPSAPSLELLIATHLADSEIPNSKPQLLACLSKVITSEEQHLSLKGIRLLLTVDENIFDKSLAQKALARFERAELKTREKLELESLRIKVGERDLKKSVQESIKRYQESDFITLIGWLHHLEQHETILNLTTLHDKN